MKPSLYPRARDVPALSISSMPSDLSCLICILGFFSSMPSYLQGFHRLESIKDFILGHLGSLTESWGFLPPISSSRAHLQTGKFASF